MNLYFVFKCRSKNKLHHWATLLRRRRTLRYSVGASYAKAQRNRWQW